jgi:beta-phosphoglucomutase-like phosphatase (HAD superfamily)
VVAAARGSQGAGVVVVVVIVNAPAAVLFDFDGVLADSRLAITRSLNHGLAAVGADERPAAELEHWIGPPLLHAFRALAGPERAEAGVAAYRERYRSASLSETVAVPAMVAAVARVAGRACRSRSRRASRAPSSYRCSTRSATRVCSGWSKARPWIRAWRRTSR